MADGKRYDDIDGDSLYKNMALGRSALLLDVRTATEFHEGHIPGSFLIPLHDLESRLSEVPNGGTPITVICEHGIRSASACQLLSEHGYGPLFNLRGGLQTWPGPLQGGSNDNGCYRHGITPSSFLVENFHHLPRGLALDLAMGAGRNAIYLATRGFDVDGVDVDPQAVADARCAARRLGAPIRAVVGNVEDGTYIIPLETYDVIVVFNFLHRPLLKDIRDGLRPGGVVIYQTFTEDQARFGPPRNPAYLLRSGELRQAFDGFETLAYRESIGDSRDDGKQRAMAGIVARRPAESSRD